MFWLVSDELLAARKIDTRELSDSPAIRFLAVKKLGKISLLLVRLVLALGIRQSRHDLAVDNHVGFLVCARSAGLLIQQLTFSPSLLFLPSLRH